MGNSFAIIDRIRILHNPVTTGFCNIFADLKIKRQQLEVALSDIPYWVEEYNKSRSVNRSSAENPKVLLFDGIPSLRLLNACESAIFFLYTVGELSAQFAHLVTKKNIPKNLGRFLNTYKKYRNYTKFNIESIFSTQSFKDFDEILKIRNELTHASALFLAGEPNNPVIIVKNLIQSDTENYKEESTQIYILELIKVIKSANKFFDDFADYLLKNYLIKIYEPNFNDTISIHKYDSNGFPRVSESGKFETESLSIREYFFRIGAI